MLTRRQARNLTRSVSSAQIAVSPEAEQPASYHSPYCDAGVTRLNGVGRKFGLRLFGESPGMRPAKGPTALHGLDSRQFPFKCVEFGELAEVSFICCNHPDAEAPSTCRNQRVIG